jgi:hypothetical protein
MNASEGILTARGGMTSHAAVVARGWGKTCVSGCSELVVDEENRWLTLGGVKLHEVGLCTIRMHFTHSWKAAWFQPFNLRCVLRSTTLLATELHKQSSEVWAGKRQEM